VLFRIGDKVKVKVGPDRGLRGIVQSVAGKMLTIREVDGKRLLSATTAELVNFSLAARKAWLSMPDRHVGRPKGSKCCNRVSVTLRIDLELWQEFLKNEKSGVIQNRTDTLNRWLREKLGEIRAEK